MNYKFTINTEKLSAEKLEFLKEHINCLFTARYRVKPHSLEVSKIMDVNVPYFKELYDVTNLVVEIE